MPAEGGRLFRRLGKRDRLFIGIAGALAVVGIVVVALTGRVRQSNAGCVVYSHPGFTGAETHRYCGQNARTFCRSGAAAHGPAVVEQCERLGLRVGRPAGNGG